MKNLSKKSLLLFSILFIGCGEITTSDTKDNNSQINNNTPQQDNIEEPESSTTATNGQGTRPAISSNSTSQLKDIIKTIQSMKTSHSNKTQYSKIIDWTETIVDEVNELTAKNFKKLISNYRKRELTYLGHDIFSTDKTLHIYENEQPTFIGLNPSKGGDVVIINKDSEIANVQDSIIICTGDLNISHSHNNIIIVNGKLTIGADGVNSKKKTDEGSIIYNKGEVSVSHSYGSVFLFEKHIETSFIYDGDCINTGTTNSSHGQCNEIKTVKLTED